MKKQFVKLFALSLAAVGISFGLQADDAVIHVEENHENVQKALSTEEQAFASKLDKQAQEAFSQMNQEQRKKVMLSASGNSEVNPNDAVQAIAKEFVVRAE